MFTRLQTCITNQLDEDYNVRVEIDGVSFTSVDFIQTLGRTSKPHMITLQPFHSLTSDKNQFTKCGIISCSVFRVYYEVEV